ncbi:MAG: AlpA family transcriptional regulator [Glaciimonas sp.]|nr:AlpA family transcriptional regulator [Glaciimonas sp.]
MNTQQIILRLPQVKVRTGLSRSSIYAAVKRGEFPSAVSLGARSVGWIDSEIQTWIETRVSTANRMAK